MNKQINTKLGIIFLIALTAIVSAYVIFEYKTFSFPSLPPISQWLRLALTPELKDIEKFTSEDDFKEYLENLRAVICMALWERQEEWVLLLTRQ